MQKQPIIIAKKLIAEGASLKTEDRYGKTLLHLAALRGHSNMVSLYLDKGISINVLEHEKETPLHGAISEGHHKIVKFLLEKGADPTLKSKILRSKQPSILPKSAKENG